MESQQVGLWVTPSAGRQALFRGAASPSVRVGPFPLPLSQAEGTFSDIYCGNLAELLEVSLTVLCGSPHDGVFLEFLTLTGKPHGHRDLVDCRAWAAERCCFCAGVASRGAVLPNATLLLHSI